MPTRHHTATSAAAALITLATVVPLAAGGVLLDYGLDAQATNDAGVVRAPATRAATFGFDQFQIFNIDSADQAWAIDAITVSLRLFTTFSGGEATLSIYAASGLEPDLLARRSDAIAFEVTSQAGQLVSIDLGGLELEAGTYFVGIEASDPATEMLWLAGDDDAFRTGRRSDGGFFTGSPRALSLSIDGAIIPAPAVPAMGLVGLGLATRRRRG